MSAQKQTTKNLTISLYHGKKTAKIKRGFDRLSVILKFNATCAAQRNTTQGNVKRQLLAEKCKYTLQLIEIVAIKNKKFVWTVVR